MIEARLRPVTWEARRERDDVVLARFLLHPDELFTFRHGLPGLWPIQHYEVTYCVVPPPTPDAEKPDTLAPVRRRVATAVEIAAEALMDAGMDAETAAEQIRAWVETDEHLAELLLDD